jgi:hypothetical protein
MSAVQPNNRRQRLPQLRGIKAIGHLLAQVRSWLYNMIELVGRAIRQLCSWFWSVIKLVGRAIGRLRPMVPAVIVAVLAGATVAAVVWLHSAARTSPDAWPSAVAAGTTATLALITLWYAYLTHRLLEAQRSAARTAGWETALRDLSLYLNRERAVIWTASDFFPIDRPGADPPDLVALADTRVAFVRIRDHLLEILGLLPRRFAVEVLPLTMRLVEADSEMDALFKAMYEAMETGRAAGRTTWTWDDAQQADPAAYRWVSYLR